MKKVLIINGSHRSEGSTYILKEEFVNSIVGEDIELDELYLSDMNIEYFNYDNEYSKEDQFDEIKEGLFSADLIVFASPIYWYSMPAKLKAVFDRFNSIYASGEIGKLEGKKVVLIYTYGGIDSDVFKLPFVETSKYLKMDYLGSFGAKSTFPKGIKEEKSLEDMKEFAKGILKKL